MQISVSSSSSCDSSSTSCESSSSLSSSATMPKSAALPAVISFTEYRTLALPCSEGSRRPSPVIRCQCVGAGMTSPAIIPITYEDVHKEGAPSRDGAKTPDWERIRITQQRLLVLQHAAKCEHTSGACRVTAHCAKMKTLWKHLQNCRNRECKVPYCVTSRLILSQYRRCQDPHCLTCTPVRTVIRMRQERNNQSLPEPEDVAQR